MKSIEQLLNTIENDSSKVSLVGLGFCSQFFANRKKKQGREIKQENF